MRKFLLVYERERERVLFSRFDELIFADSSKTYSYYSIKQMMPATKKPARIPPQTPPPRGQNAKTKISRGFAKSKSPENSFGKTESAFRPATLPEYLEGRTPKRKKSFPFSEKIGRAQIRKARNIFSFWGCRVKRGGGGAIVRAYDSGQSHHALRAYLIRGSAGSKSELFGIMTTILNLKKD